MNYMKINPNDIANGEGVCVSIFVSGCSHRCVGCFNSEAWDYEAGEKFTWDTIRQVITAISQNGILRNLSILGGEPLMQDDSLYNLLKRIKEETNKNIWLWTGYEMQEIPLNQRKVLDYVDVLIDGRFELDKRNLNLKYRGSENQKVYFKENGLFVIKDVDIF